MSAKHLYLRFGVHKDRAVMQETSEIFAGLVIPAHIFCYSTNATIAALSYINKPFFIDPMTYLLADEDIGDYVTISKDSKKQFKPSIAKLVDSYGLAGSFEESGYLPLTIADFTDDFVTKFAKASVDLQLNKIDQEKDSAVKKYKDLLNEVGENRVADLLDNDHEPFFLTTPYFYFNSSDKKGWLDVCIKIANKIKELEPDREVAPVLLTDSISLDNTVLAKLKSYSKIVIWVNDLNEKTQISSNMDNTVAKFSRVANFVKSASEAEIDVFNLYGGYFSACLTKIGLSGFSNGIFYGEYKSRKASVGGVPPSRYYLRKLHDFLAIPATIALLKTKKYENLFDEDCKECLNLIDGNKENIFLFDKNHSLAQKHFLYSRQCELECIENSTMEEIIKAIEDSFKKYAPLPATIADKSLVYLQIWSKSLKQFCESDAAETD